MKVPKARKLSSGKWFIQLRLNGESIPVTADTEAKCQAEAAAIKSGLKKVQAGKGTLRHAIDKYIDSKKNVLSPSTIRGYRAYQRRYLQAYMDADMTRVNWQKAVDNEVCSPKTLKNVWNLAKAAMEEQGFSATVKLPKVKKTQMPWLTSEQIPIFLKAIQGKQCEMPALLGLHSLRRSEMFGLSWDDVNLADNLIRVSKTVVMDENHELIMKSTAKTRESIRTIPIMIPRLYELLSETEDKTGAIIKANLATPYEQINKICRENGLPEVGVHGLRRSFASLGYSLGMREEEIMSIGGWTDFQTVHKFYIYLSDLDKKKAQNRMSGFYSGHTKSDLRAKTISVSDVVSWMRKNNFSEETVNDFLVHCMENAN